MLLLVLASVDGSWEKYFTSVSLSFPRGEMRTMKGSCQEVGMSAIVIVLPSLRVRQGAGDQGQVWVLPLWAALSPPLAPFPALSPSAVLALVPPQLCGTSEQALVCGNGKRLVGVGRAEEWRLGAHCQGGPECGGMWTR